MITYAQRLRELVRILGTPERPIGQRALAEYLGTSQVTVSHWWGGRPVGPVRRVYPRPTGPCSALILLALTVGELHPELVRTTATLPLGDEWSGWGRIVRILGYARAARLCNGPRQSLDAWRDAGREPLAVRRIAVLLEACELFAPEVIETIKSR
jgi:hypothetical protein